MPAFSHNHPLELQTLILIVPSSCVYPTKFLNSILNVNGNSRAIIVGNSSWSLQEVSRGFSDRTCHVLTFFSEREQNRGNDKMLFISAWGLWSNPTNWTCYCKPNLCLCGSNRIFVCWSIFLNRLFILDGQIAPYWIMVVHLQWCESEYSKSRFRSLFVLFQLLDHKHLQYSPLLIATKNSSLSLP